MSAPYDPSQSQPGAQQYGQPNYGYAMSNPNVIQNASGQWVDVSHIKSNATVVLIMGILGIVGILPLVGSLVAWIWGNSILRTAQDMGVPEQTVSLAKVGKILGIIGVCLAIATIVIVVAIIAIFASMSVSISNSALPIGL